MVIDYFIIFSFAFIALFILLKQYSIVQSCHYEFYKYLKCNSLKKFFSLFINSFLFIFWLFVNGVYKNILLLLSLITNLFFSNNKNKIHYTNRIKRFMIVYIFVTSVFLFTFNNKFLVISLINFWFTFYLYIIHFISCSIERCIMNFYINDAKKIIKNVKVIGITGSYGKTSCKNILYDLLKDDFNVNKTPKSYNTKVGIVKSIRENVNNEDDYFICEYGVDKKGGMNKLLKIAKPSISWVTAIGNQHILTFKSIENIVSEKLKLVKVLDNERIAIINNDNEYLRKEIPNLKCKVITYGIKNTSYIMAKNIKISKDGSSFDLYIKSKKYKRLNTILLGEHNILNILGAIGALVAIGVDLTNIEKKVALVAPIEHRLKVKTLQGVKIIDDSFNSNEIGFKKAIDILNLMDEEKYIVTPGVIEQGENSYRVNYELGKYMSKKIDFAILVEDNATVLKRGLLDGGFQEERIIIKKDFQEAWLYIKNINSGNKIFLIENDLPNIYLK